MGIVANALFLKITILKMWAYTLITLLTLYYQTNQSLSLSLSLSLLPKTLLNLKNLILISKLLIIQKLLRET